MKIKLGTLKSLIREEVITNESKVLSEGAEDELLSRLRIAQDALTAAKRLLKHAGVSGKLYADIDKLHDGIADVSIGVHHLSGTVTGSQVSLESRRRK